MGRILEIPFGESHVPATLPDDTFIVPYRRGRRPERRSRVVGSGGMCYPRPACKCGARFRSCLFERWRAHSDA